MGNCCPSRFLGSLRFLHKDSDCRRPECLPKPPDGGELETPMLTVLKVDPLITENGEAHHTSRYEIMNRSGTSARLVVRRGQEFSMRLHLNRDYDEALDAVSLVFTLDGAKKPQYSRGTFTVVPLLRSGGEAENWQAILERLEINAIKIKIIPPADALIGKWKLEIDAKRANYGGAISFSLKEPFYVIFNAWCPEDPVFLDDKEGRQEYILEETGLIWRGNYKLMRPTVWNYSQFDKDILDCALYVMTQVGKVWESGRNDPVVISRMLSAVINSPDDDGVVAGNWSGDHSGGTAPTKWLGSKKILQEFFRTKRPVKYGQCWVFAGVLATVCRTLGLPCRVVTNFSSAHDTQGSLTVDYFFDEAGRIMDELNSDSIWNFHVWVEVWMKRLDLGPDYAGWQAIDATPQEKSSGAYRCGPASVEAVKRGEVLRPYDTGFLFAEINADKVYWRYNGPTQPLKLISKDINGIGKQISTKTVGAWTRQDITHIYKYNEQSEEERETMLKALRQNHHLYSRYYLNEEFNDIMFHFELLDDILVGQPFSVVLLMKNRSSEVEYRVSVVLRVDVVQYTGRVGDAVKNVTTDRRITSGAVEETRLTVSWEEYGPRMLEQSAFSIVCLATVKETNYEYLAEDDFRVKKPDIDIERKTEAIVGQVLQAEASFVNPLPVALKKGKFVIEGPGLEQQLKIKLSEHARPGERVTCRFSMTPKLKGRATIIAKFSSNELDDVEGFVNFMVKPEKTESNGNY